MEAPGDRNLLENIRILGCASRDVIRAHLGKLYVVLVELLFHNLLENSQNEDLRFREGHLLQADLLRKRK